MAVFVVTGVGSTVDYLKEQEFTKRTREENAGYKVSPSLYHPYASLTLPLCPCAGPRHP